jgi:hypothetical protein
MSGVDHLLEQPSCRGWVFKISGQDSEVQGSPRCRVGMVRRAGLLERRSGLVDPGRSP